MVEEKRNINIYFFINFYCDEDINTSFYWFHSLGHLK